MAVSGHLITARSSYRRGEFNTPKWPFKRVPRWGSKRVLLDSENGNSRVS